MEDPDWLIIKLKALWNWLRQKRPSIKIWLWNNPTTIPTWFQGIGALLQVGIAVVMVYALIQNSKIINATSESLKIEQETRLNPELECAYNWFKGGFIIRNVGDAAAEVSLLEPCVYFVKSNEVTRLYPIRGISGTILPPLEKSVLLPGDASNAKDVYNPDAQWVSQVGRENGGDILLRLYVEYYRRQPTFRRYSGYFNFSFDRSALRFPVDTPKTYYRWLTEEENPYMKTTIERFNLVPETQFFIMSHMGTNGFEKFPMFMQRGLNSSIVGGSNATSVVGSWAKLQ